MEMRFGFLAHTRVHAGGHLRMHLLRMHAHVQCHLLPNTRARPHSLVQGVGERGPCGGVLPGGTQRAAKLPTGPEQLGRGLHGPRPVDRRAAPAAGGHRRGARLRRGLEQPGRAAGEPGGCERGAQAGLSGAGTSVGTPDPPSPPQQRMLLPEGRRRVGGCGGFLRQVPGAGPRQPQRGCVDREGRGACAGLPMWCREPCCVPRRVLGPRSSPAPEPPAPARHACAGQNRLLSLNYVHHGEEAVVCDAHREWGERFEARVEPLAPRRRVPEDSAPGRRLKVGHGGVMGSEGLARMSREGKVRARVIRCLLRFLACSGSAGPAGSRGAPTPRWSPPPRYSPGTRPAG